MTGFNSQSQITVNWQNNGFAKVLSEIKQIEEAAKRLNISGATKKGADVMLKNVKSIKSEQQKLAELELARVKNENQKIKNEREKRRENNKRRRREYEDNQKKIKEKELSDAKKLEDEKTKILNDAQTKQAFLRKQRATNERKERLARDLKAIQEDRMLTKHQRNIEIAERKKAFAEEERLISSKRFAAAKRMEKGYINKYGVNSIEAVNAANRRVEAENALSNKNSLLANAGGNLNKARIASDEFNKKETERAKNKLEKQANKLEDARRLNNLSKAELKVGAKRISEHEKDIQNTKNAVNVDKILLKQKIEEIKADRVRLKMEHKSSAEYLSIKSKITDGLTESHKIQTRINNGQLQYHDAKEAKRVHQINRDAQFYTRANVALTAPVMIGAYNAMSALKERERMDLVLIGMHGAENLKAEREKLLQVQYKSSLSLDNIIKVEQITGMYANKEAQSGRTVNKDEVSQAMRDVLSLTTLNGRDVGMAIRQLQDITRQGYALPKRDLQTFLNRVLGLDFDAVYKKLYGKFYSGDGKLESRQVVDILVAAMKEPKALQQKEAQKSGYTMAEERLGETVHNLSGEFGKLLNETIGLTEKFNSASDSLDGLRKWFAERNPDGSPKTSQKAVIGAAVAVAGTLLMGLLISHKRKAMEFFFKGDVGKFGDFKKSFSDSRGVGRGFIGSSKNAFKESGLGSGTALKGFSAVGAIQGTYDLVVAKTLADWAIGSAEITVGLTGLFGPYGTVAGMLLSLEKAMIMWWDKMSNDKNSWAMKLGDKIGNYFYDLANSDQPVYSARKAIQAEKDAGGTGDITIQRLAAEYKAKAIHEAKAAALISASKNYGVNYKPVPIVNIMNSVNNTATSGISVKSDIETKQMGGQSYPSL